MLVTTCRLVKEVCVREGDSAFGFELGTAAADSATIMLHHLQAVLKKYDSSAAGTPNSNNATNDNSGSKSDASDEGDDKENSSRGDAGVQNEGVVLGGPLSPRNGARKPLSAATKEAKDVKATATTTVLPTGAVCASMSTQALQTVVFNALPHLLSALSTLMQSGVVTNDNKNSALKGSFVWYLSTTGLLSTISHLFHLLQPLPTSITSVLTRELGVIVKHWAWFLCESSGLAEEVPVTTFASLSNKKFVHPNGKSVLSLIRNTRMGESIASALETQVQGFAEEGDNMQARFDTCASLMCALLTLGTADLNLLQGLSAAAQTALASTLAALLKHQLESGVEEPRMSHWVPYCLCEGPGFSVAQNLALQGLLFLRNKDLQQFMAKSCARGGDMQPIIQHLCRFMPIKFYTDERFKMQLLPTLSSMSLGCAEAEAVVSQEISKELLGTHASKLCRDLEGVLKREKDLPDVTLPSQLVQLSMRFPTEMWTESQLTK
jgi:hypothetical protein